MGQFEPVRDEVEGLVTRIGRGGSNPLGRTEVARGSDRCSTPHRRRGYVSGPHRGLVTAGLGDADNGAAPPHKVLGDLDVLWDSASLRSPPTIF
jgi:hypothetical protein